MKLGESLRIAWQRGPARAEQLGNKLSNIVNPFINGEISKIRLAIVGVFLGIGAVCVEKTIDRPKHDKYHASENLYNPPVGPVNDVKLTAIKDELAGRFGQEAADFAINTVSNGAQIKDSQGKDKQLSLLKADIQSKYPKIRPLKLFGYCDEVREAEQIAILYAARKSILAAHTKYRYYLPMSFILASLSTEGYSLDLDYEGHDSPDGFENFGNDTFGSEFDKIVKTGIIPAGFKDQFSTAEKNNEKNKKVISAIFKSKQAAFTGFVAMLAYNQHLFYEDLRRKNISNDGLSPDERLFFTYFYYNAGPNSLDKTLYTEDDVHRFFYEMKNIGARANAYKVMTGSKWLDASGALDQKPEGKYWWNKTPQTKTENPIKVDQLEVESYQFDQARVTEPWLWLLKTAREEGWKGSLDGSSKGLRSYAQQKHLYNLFKSGHGAPAFNPDGKNAENARHLSNVVKRKGLWSMAVDVSDPETLIKIAAKHGIKLHNPYVKEPWHVEAIKPFSRQDD